MNTRIYVGGQGFGRYGRGLFSCLNRLLSMSVRHIRQDKLFFDLRSSTYCSRRGANALDTLFAQEEIDCEEKRVKGPDLTTNLSLLREAYKVFFEPIIRPEIKARIDEFEQFNFGRSTLGVHIRSTDRKTDGFTRAQWSRLTEDNIVEEVELQMSKGDHDKIFIATDYIGYRRALSTHFGECVCFFSDNISNSQTSNIHHDLSFNKEEIMVEAFIDSLLLSRCDFLLRTMSNLTIFSLAANPNLNFLDLSIKHNSYKARAEEWLSQ
jgi:hypothetical protein